MAFKKYFTLEEANALVPFLLEVMPRAQDLSARLSRDFPDVKKAWKKSRVNGGSMQGVDYLRLAFEFQSCQRAIEERGIIIKGVDNGLVDFPSLRDGQEVFLCWRMPETEIRFWHDLDSGFAGRQPV